MTIAPTAIELSGLRKAYGATMALADVDLVVSAQSVHGLIGGNGAGKSTILKILTGITRADAGTIKLFGHDYRPDTPFDALQQGVAIIPQELRVVSGLSVADNVVLGNWPRTKGWLGRVLPSVDTAQAKTIAAHHLGRLGLRIDPARPMSDLSFAERQSVVIARAIARQAQVLILDEPTAALAAHEANLLFALIATLKAAGITIIYVSHRLDEIVALCDRVTGLRDGRIVANRERGGFDTADLVGLIATAGTAPVPQAASHSAGAIVLRADGPVAGGNALSVAERQVVGLHGLLGSGISPFLRSLFGADGGRTVTMRGTKTEVRSPRQAIAQGIGYVPSERFRAIVPALSVRDNILLPHLDRFSPAGRLKAAAMDATVEPLMDLLDIRPRNPGLRAGALSGGNQQKVLFARWLVGATRLLCLDEPTHGVDVGAKILIKQQIMRFAAAGGGVLMHSVERDDLVELADVLHTMVAGELGAPAARGDRGFEHAASGQPA